MSLLRKCVDCGLEAHTEKDLETFVSRINLCNKCKAKRVKESRATDDEVYLKYKLTTIKTRCYNPHYKAYDYYGGRGIVVCQEWLDDPNAFVDWTHSSGWRRGLEIDRIDTDGPYSPQNCRWVTRKDQQRNRRNCTTFPEKGTRICCKCKVEKPLTDFHVDRRAPQGRTYVCKECRNKRRH